MQDCLRGKRKLICAASVDVSRDIAVAYGWTNWVSIQTYAAMRPHLYPSRTYQPSESISLLDARTDSIDLPIEAVMLLEAPSEWYDATVVVHIIF